MQHRLMSAAEIGRLLCLSPVTLHHWEAVGRIPPAPRAGRVRVYPLDHALAVVDAAKATSRRGRDPFSIVGGAEAARARLIERYAASHAPVAMAFIPPRNREREHEPRGLTINEVARALGVSRMTIHRWEAAGRIPRPPRCGHGLRAARAYDVSALLSLLAALEATASAFASGRNDAFPTPESVRSVRERLLVDLSLLRDWADEMDILGMAADVA